MTSIFLENLRSRASHTIFPKLTDAKASALLAALYQLESAQDLDPEEFKALQMGQVRDMLIHASQTVPFYRKRFAGINFKRAPVQEISDLICELPVLTRDQVNKNEDKLVSDNIPGDHGKVIQVFTSGSSGTPLKVLSTELSRFFWQVFTIRDHLWHKRDITGVLAVIRRGPRDKGMPPDGETNRDWGPPGYVASTGPAYFLNIATPLEDQVKWLLRRNPHYLTTFPSNLGPLAEYFMDKGLTLENLSHVSTVGETVSATLRKKVREAFGVGIKDMYTCEETGYIALQCPEYEHYHAQSENVLVEIVNEKGQPCSRGEIGHLLITTLHNYAMPLIRYDLGDMAEWGEACPLKKNLPVISRIHGRQRNRLIMPDGKSEFPYMGEDGDFTKLTGKKPKQFQFVQKSKEEIVVSLVLDSPMTADQESSYAKQLQENFGHPFKISFRYPEKIPKKPNDKFEEFVCEVEK